MQKIEVTETGPHHELTLEVPDSGFVLLRGRNDAGKSHALMQLEALAGTRDANDLVVRDGADEGLVRGLDATIVVRRKRETPIDKPEGRNKRTGELSVQSLSGLNPFSIIDPNIDDPVRRDAARIKTLCDLLGIRGGIDAFSEALGVNVKPYATAATLKCESLVEMASKLKRDIQDGARDAETKTATLEGEARANLAAAGGVESGEPADMVDHDGNLRAAQRAQEALNDRAVVASKAKAAAKRSQERLDQLRANSAGPTVEQGKAAMEETLRNIDDTKAKLAQLNDELRTFQAKANTLGAQLTAAQERERMLAECESTIAESANANAVSDGEIAAASKAVSEATAAKDASVLDAERRRRFRAAQESLAKADDMRAKAATLRDLAGKCETVISDAINKRAPSGLSVTNDRLTIQDGATLKLFDDLSHGMRTRVVVGIAARSFGKGRALLVVPQEIVEGMDLERRTELAQIAKDEGVLIVGAKEADGALRVEEVAAAASA